jgi:hypothetical protein
VCSNSTSCSGFGVNILQCFWSQHPSVHSVNIGQRAFSWECFLFYNHVTMLPPVEGGKRQWRYAIAVWMMLVRPRFG